MHITDHILSIHFLHLDCSFEHAKLPLSSHGSHHVSNIALNIKDLTAIYLYVTLSLRQPGHATAAGRSCLVGAMDGNTTQIQQRTLQPQSLANIIRADQVHRLPHLGDEQKAKYEQGVKQLWEVIESRPQNSPEYQQAYHKLVQVSQNIRTSLDRWRAQNQPQQAQGAAKHDSLGGQHNPSRVQNQGQQGQSEASQAPGPAPPQTVPQMTPQVSQQGQNLPFIVPPNVEAAGPAQAADWLRQATAKYGKARQTVEFASTQLKELANRSAQLQREGRSFSPEEFQKLQTRKAQLSKVYSDNKEILTQFKNQQDSLRAQQTQHQNTGPSGAAQADNAHAHQGSHHSPITTSQQPIHQHMPPGHGAPHTVNSAIDAARSQANAPLHPSMSPSNAGQQHSGQIPTLQLGSAAPGQPQLPQQPLNINTSSSAQQQTNSPQTAQPNSAIQGPPRPLSHQMAMAQAARSYSNPNFQQSTPQSAGVHPHPQIGNVEQTNSNVKMRIPKKLDISEPQPVAMGPARPTMSGGPSNGAMGMMGQPAIPKHPGFVLEGEGERVLSKRKLDELVRQVTGGGESLGGEGLSADVEEVSYQSYCVLLLLIIRGGRVAARRVPKLSSDSCIRF